MTVDSKQNKNSSNDSVGLELNQEKVPEGWTSDNTPLVEGGFGSISLNNASLNCFVSAQIISDYNSLIDYEKVAYKNSLSPEKPGVKITKIIR